jgi:SAM-dependent methyltransferase
MLNGGLFWNGMNWHERFLQQAGWTRDLRTYLFAQAGLARARRILEVGCGTGAVLADLNTPAALHGLDIDPGRLVQARMHAPKAALLCADAHYLPYASKTFQVTYCHYLLLWVSDPLRVLLEMKRVTRPGGAVLALAEPDHTLRRDEPPSLAPLGCWQTEALRRQGADPGLGSRLGDLFHQAGLTLIETGSLRTGEGRRLLPAEWKLEWEVLESDLAGTIPRDELSKMKELDENAWRDGERTLYVPTFFAHGVV